MLRTLVAEMQYRRDYLQGQKVQTVYFGGGTPSLLQEDDIAFLWKNLHQYFDLSELSEVTFEANPDDLSDAYLQMLKFQNISRLSIGVQSFHEQDLQYMNRAHTASDASECIAKAQKAGFDNISIDLIYGTPGLSDNEWRQNVQIAINAGVMHLSAYALTVESKTILHYNINRGLQPEPDVAQMAQQFEILMEQTEAAGFEHYEISNFARNKQYAIHNTSYWKGAHYLGLGPSAHSYNGIGRQWNVANNTLYINNILEKKVLPLSEEILSETDQYNEYIMVSLRTQWGISIDWVKEKFGTDKADILYNALLTLEKKQQVYQYKDGYFALTKSGKFFADGITALLFE